MEIDGDRAWMHKAHERFPIVSTFKTLACAALLARVDDGEETLERRIVFEDSERVAYSPVLDQVEGASGLTLETACEATLATSDNTAANLILREIGGPRGLTAFLRGIGDGQTRLDRYETALNEGLRGDLRDTTTPAAMAKTMRALLLEEDVLSPAAQGRLRQWLEGNRVADALFRAGVPDAWSIADRSGAGGNGARAIAAVMWPPGRGPVVAAVYIADADASLRERNEAIAEIGSAIADAVEDERAVSGP